MESPAVHAPRYGPVGIVCNPASGKDVRRLTARASVFDNQEKQAIVRRAVVGALAAGASQFRYLPDSHQIAQSALDEFGGKAEAKPVDCPETGSALDTIRSAQAFRDAGCSVVITLGGDGTNRAFSLGWRDAPLLPISTGTNNVFPRVIEATVAGAAAGALSCGRVTLADVAKRSKAVSIDIEGERSDLALIDAVATSDRFVGSRALMRASSLRMALLTRADPAAVGITSIGGLLHPLSQDEDAGLLLELGEGGACVNAPIAPGHYQEIGVRSFKTVTFGETVEIATGGTLAFDGERERVLRPGQSANARVDRDGPWVVDVERVLAHAAQDGWFQSGKTR
jgi:hypothetical protein